MTAPLPLHGLESSLEAEIADIVAACHAALSTGFAGLCAAVPSLPNTAGAAFDFLHTIGFGARALPQFAQWIGDAQRAGIDAPYAVERYLVLQAFCAALPRLSALAADDSVKRQLCNVAAYLTTPGYEQDQRLDYRSDAFEELALLVSLRRFHGGQLSFDLSRFPIGSLLWWSLSVHPRDLLRWLWMLTTRVAVFGPVAMPHLCYWRAKPGFMLAKEQARSLCSLARTIALYPKVKGLAAVSWLYAPQVGAESPHLAWTRDFFVDQGATIIGLGPAQESDGFLVGSERRRKLYADGKFQPEMTWIFWHRDDLLRWAEAYERDTASGDAIKGAAHPARKASKQSQANMRVAGVWTAARRFLFRRPKTYAFAVLMLPALTAALIAGALLGPWFGVAALPVAAAAMWLFQYFVLLGSLR